MKKSHILFIALLLFIAICAMVRFGSLDFFKSNDTISTALAGDSSVVQPISIDILNGKWAFEIRSKSYDEIIIMNGVAIYNNSNEFIKRFTFKQYKSGHGEAEIEEGKEELIGGGTITGSLSVYPEYWTETRSKCNLETSRGSDDLCEIFEEQIRYGNVIEDTKSSQIKVLNNSKIEIEGENLASEAKFTIVYTKKQ